MKYYLSSYKIGEKGEKLKELVGDRKIGLISNSKDYHDEETLDERVNDDTESLENLGLKVERLDLKEYFGKKDELKGKLDEFGGVWVSGGNIFVLRQAMYLSGFDEILKNLDRENFVYSGDSAGGCVLSPSLDAYKIVDDSSLTPYQELGEVIREGLGILGYVLVPHYKSDHPESEYIDKTVDYCEQKEIPYKALRDGGVIVYE